MGQTGFITKTVVAAIALLSASAAQAKITYEGQIVKPDGTPMTGAVTVKIQIKSPGPENCRMYDETQVVNATSDGFVTVVLNDGNGTRNDANAFSFDEVFSNAPAGGTHTFVGGYCDSGSTYTPAAGDGRRLVVFAKDASMASFEEFPAIAVNSVPFAKQAEQVGGVKASEIVRVPTANVAPLTLAVYNQILALAAGTSSLYEQGGSVQAFAKSALPTCSAGEYLRENAGTLVCSTPAGGGGGSVTSVTSSNSVIAITNTTTTPVLTLSQANGSTDGYLSSADWNTFNNMQPALGFVPANQAGDSFTGFITLHANPTSAMHAATKQYVDSAISGGSSPTGAAGGDLSGSYPNPSVARINGNAVSSTALSAPDAGKAMVWNGSQYGAQWFGIQDLRTSIGGNQFASANCSASQTLTWSALTDSFTCSAIAGLNASVITAGTIPTGRLPIGTTAATVAAGDDARFGNAVALQSRNVSSTAPVNGQVLTWNNSGSVWEPASIPAAGNFYADGSIPMSAQFRASIGTVALPGLSFNGDTDTGFSRPNAAVIETSIDGVPSLSLTPASAAVSGYSATPKLALRRAQGSYASETQVGSAQPLGVLSFQGWEAASGFWEGAYIRGIADQPWGGGGRGSSLSFATTGMGLTTPTERMRIANDGKVGIGTTSPGAQLEVVEDGASFTGIRVTNNTTASYAGAGVEFRNDTGQLGWIYAASTLYGSGLDDNLVVESMGSGTTFLNQNSSDFRFITNISQERLTIKGAGGDVGIGTTAPRAKLDVNGAIVSRASQAYGVATIDFSASNLAHTTLNCQAFTLNNMRDGGSYALLVKGTSSTTCSFTATGGLTVHLPPDHGMTIAGKMTYYNFTVLGTDVIVSWTPGY